MSNGRENRGFANRAFGADRRDNRRIDRAERRGVRNGVRSERRADRRDSRGYYRSDRGWRDQRFAYGRGYRDGRRDFRNWNRRGWRNDRRFGWRNYRAANRSFYRLGRYYAPFYGHSYSRLRIGFYLDNLFFGQRYWISDPWAYRLPPVYGPYRWVRYYDDVVLVDIYTGEVVDVIHDFFW